MPLPVTDPNHSNDRRFYILEGILLPGSGLLPIWRGNRLDLYNGSLFGPNNQALVGSAFYCLAFDLHRSELRLYEFESIIPPELITNPVRVQLEESLSGPVVSASISFSTFAREPRDIGSRWMIGSRLEPAASFYAFYIERVDPNEGLVDYTGETYIRRLGRIPATRQVLLPPSGGPYTPKQCLEAVLNVYDINYFPLPELELLGADGPITLQVPAFAYFPPKKEEQKEPESVLELIQRILAPFEGYYLRAPNYAWDYIQIIPASWTPANNIAKTLNNRDILAIDVGEIDADSVVNRCIVRAKGAAWTDDPVAVMEPASFGLRGSFRPSEGNNPAFTVAHPVKDDLSDKKLNDPPILDASKIQRGSLLWPMQANTVIGDQQLQISYSITHWIYELATGQYGPYNESGTANLPLDGSSVAIINRGYGLGAALEYANLLIYATWDAQNSAVRLDYVADLYSRSVGVSGSGVAAWGFRIALNGSARKLDIGDQTVAVFGESFDTAPGLQLSQSAYGVRSKTLEMNYQLSPEQAMQIAQIQVARQLNPKRIYRVRQAASMIVRPDWLGKPVIIPNPEGIGTLRGVVRSWRYVEAHSPSGVQADSEFELELTESLLGDTDANNGYAQAIYGLSPYVR